MFEDRYGADVLASAPKQQPQPPKVPAATDLVVEHTETEWCGAIVRVTAGAVELEDGRGRIRVFPLGKGYMIDGKPIELVMPGKLPQASSGRKITASGSFATDMSKAKVARESRIYVEGRHDAELIERVWGHDLRAEGVVVEYMGGIDDLNQIVKDFRPSQTRKLGVLVDHLVTGSKESRLAQAAMSQAQPGSILILGHPYIDVWQSVKPARLSITSWPVIPRGVEWKKGICQALGWPHRTQADIARAWQNILGQVRDYRDLEPSLLGRMEELIDFVTAP